jgi:hypothetical protein
LRSLDVPLARFRECALAKSRADSRKHCEPIEQDTSNVLRKSIRDFSSAWPRRMSATRARQINEVQSSIC